MKTLGICFGATSMQCVILQADPELKTVISAERLDHEGNPRRAFLDYLERIDVYSIDRVAVTGRSFRHAVLLSTLSESEAVEVAVREEFGKGPYPDSLISSGGETQLVYKINKQGGIVSVNSGNKCASGTGEFFQQQVRRMGLRVADAVNLTAEGTPYKIAGRCSVFCKSDCTHAMNKGVPVKDVVAGLCVMMADKIDELIKDKSHDTIALIGGGVLNSALVDILRSRYTRVIIPAHAAAFEAYGAALWALDNPCLELPASLQNTVKKAEPFLSYHPPLQSAEHLVTVKTSERGTVQPDDICILGLDVGSTTTKAILLRTADKKILADVYLRTSGNPVAASRQCYASLLEQIGDTGIRIIGLGVTGSGRQIAGLHALTDDIINEIIAHATAAAFYDDAVNTIFEIGGQDAKYTFLTGGVPSDYAMNEACSAGTGSFLEESAFETLGVLTEEIGERALQASLPPDFSDQCAAFISSDIKRAVQHGVTENDILAGLVYSICMNYLNRVKGHRAVGKKVFMQGGVCYNKAVPVAMASLLRTEIIVPPDPGLMGALGVALEVARRIDSGASCVKEFDLRELAGRSAVNKGTFTCNGGKEKCDRKCTITRLEINNKVYAFGGICDRYYNLRINKRIDDIDELDLVTLRQKLMLEKYGPTLLLDGEAESSSRTVGLNRSLLFHSLYPLFSNFFSRLGFTVVVPENADPEGVARTEASFCLPVCKAHGSFYELLAKKCDYIFLPHIMQLPVPNVPTYSRLCPFIQGEPYYLKTTFRKEIEESGVVILQPVLRLERGYAASIDTFVTVAARMGVSEKRARIAYSYACEKQYAFENELARIGKKALHVLSKRRDTVGIVLFGRPYNAFAGDNNMGIPHKVATRGYTIIPHDMLPVNKYPVDKKMFWAMGQKIMKAAQFVKAHDNLFGFYITNFSCGPDSFLLGYFRNVMQEKPSLTLELDQHTADAGVDTRIEAALDIITRYRSIDGRREEYASDFQPARVAYPYVYSSNGEKLLITDPRVEVLIPSFGHKASEMVAAILRSEGIHARALPIATKDELLIGKKNTTCKECLPYILNTGTFISYLNKKGSSEKVSVFAMATGGGPCRLGQYYRALEEQFRMKKIPNAALLTVTDENSYNGLGAAILLRAWQGIILTDILSDIESMLRVAAKDSVHAMRVYNALWKKCIAYFEGKLSIRFSSFLKFMSMRLARIPLQRNPADIPVVSLVGEIFVRRDEFSRRNIVDYLERNGFMVRVAPLAEYICYGNYVINNGLGERKLTFQELVKIRLSTSLQEWWEKRIKTILATSGLYKAEMIEVARTIDGVRHLLNENFRGECILTVGLGMREIVDDSCGVVSIGPFGCMYSRIAEAMLKKEMNVEGKKRMPGWEDRAAAFAEIGTFPFLSVETDGSPFPQLVEARLEAFMVQARRVHRRLRALHGRKTAVHAVTVEDMVTRT